MSLHQELLHTLIAITRHKNKLGNRIKIHFKDGVRVCVGTRVQKSSKTRGINAYAVLVSEGTRWEIYTMSCEQEAVGRGIYKATALKGFVGMLFLAWLE